MKAEEAKLAKAKAERDKRILEHSQEEAQPGTKWTELGFESADATKDPAGSYHILRDFNSLPQEDKGRLRIWSERHTKSIAGFIR